MPGVNPVAAAIWPTVLFVCGFVVLQFGGLDDWIISRFYDAQQHAFPLRNAFLTQTVLHDGGRRAMQLFVALLVVALLASPFVARLKPWRWRLLYLVIAIGLSVGTVNVGKRVSNVDCPWDLTAFGGDRVHYGLFDRKPPSAPVGKCFPGGHSSGGFALLALYFVGVASGMRHARRLLVPGLLIGGVFALDQWVRGAHFPSHDLTTAYLCWMLSLVCYRLLPARHRQPGG